MDNRKKILSVQWVPSVYLMQGLLFALVTGLSPILYKVLKFENDKIIFFTSFLMLPWILKFFLCPFFEKFHQQKTVTVAMQFISSFLTVLVAASLIFLPIIGMQIWFYLSWLLFFSIGLSASIHDINSDGLYLNRLNYYDQAHFIGIRTACYHFGKLLCQAGLVFLVGIGMLYFEDIKTWSLSFLVLSLSIIIVSFYNVRYIPNEEKTQPSISFRSALSYKSVILEFRKIPHLTMVCIFILFYSFPESQLIKILPLFMLDAPNSGGLGLPVEYVGFIYGGLGFISMLIGITLSGFILKKWTIQKCLLPFTIISSLTNTTYLLLVFYPSVSLVPISLCVSLGEFGFGLSNGVFMLYIVRLFSEKNYSMSLYALGTTIMLLGMMITGSMSGFLQSFLGYPLFFVWIACSGIFIVLLSYKMRKIV